MSCVRSWKKIARFCGLQQTHVYPKNRLEHNHRSDAKLKKLSVRQDRSSKEQNFDSIRIFDISLPTFVKDLLSYGPKHPIRDKFNETHFSADIDKLIKTLRENGTDGKKLYEIEASKKWYAKTVRETPSDRGVVERAKFLKDNDILAVPFDKCSGFCVMKRQSYHKKLPDVLDWTQFYEIASTMDNIALKIQKDINSALLDMKKSSLINKEVYQKMRSTGAQPVRLYDLAKVHKNGIPLRPVLSIPGSSYCSLNKFLTPLFDKVPGANIETSTLDARRNLESVILGFDENIVSLDAKSLYTNVLVIEAIKMALRSLFSSDDDPATSGSTLKTLLKLALTNVCFKSNDR